MNGRSLDEASEIWRTWFAAQGWKPFAFQEKAWSEYARGRSGLITVPTGSGKTYAAYGGPFMELLALPRPTMGAPLRVLYLSPMRALARDVAAALRKPIEDLKLPFKVGLRTGDSTSGERARMRKSLPDVLATTPESLALLLTEPNANERLAQVRAVIVDEWHELMGSKRGSLLELTLARLRWFAPEARVWALSATIANLRDAAQTAAGVGRPVAIVQEQKRRERIERQVEIRSILPERISAYPWFGFSGLRLCQEVIKSVDPDVSTLIFVNTRSQAERWFEAILAAKPEWRDRMGLHHGSLDRVERERVEDGARDGALTIVVATSSLDLGVDFPSVQKVIQIGTVKGFGRAVQRAGRAFHQPGKPTALWICPAHLLETVEISALREGLKKGAIERRQAYVKPMDVLVQFILNCAYGDGVSRAELATMARSAVSFQSLSEQELDWALELVVAGGYSLQAYPEFRKLALHGDRYRFSDPRVARLHKMNVGTIISESGVRIKLMRGATLGTVDESFVAGLKPGAIFQFAGRSLKLLHVREMTAFVRLAKGQKAATPAWDGRLFPISSDLAEALRAEVDRLARGATPLSPELEAFREAADRQAQDSAIPRLNELLLERWRGADGHHLFVFPFAGRAMHEGLGHLLAFRLSRSEPNSISVSANEFGFELTSAQPLDDDRSIRSALSDRRDLESDVEASLNFPEMAKRAFREIARVAGLIQLGFPGDRKSVRGLQMSSSLLFDVFRRYDPEHLLLRQAYQEVRDRQLQICRLGETMRSFETRRFLFKRTADLTPFSFPLYVERARSKLSSEDLDARIARLQERLREKAGG